MSTRDATRITHLETPVADVATYLDELRSVLASHDSAFAAIRRAELEQRVSPSLRGGTPKGSVGSDAAANTLGNVLPFAGHLSLLVDPAMDTITARWFADDGTYPTGRQTAADFGVRYHLNSGTTPATHNTSYVGREWSSGAVGGSACDFNSAHLQFQLGGYTAACDETITLEGPYQGNSTSIYGYFATHRNLVFPYLVCGVKLTRFTEKWVTADLTSYTAVLYLVKNANDAGEVILAQSETIDIKAMPADVPYQAYASAASTTISYGDRVSLRLVLHPVVSASGSTQPFLMMAEPQIHFSYTPDLLPFAPYLGRWQPSRLKSGPRNTTDALIEFNVRDTTYNTWIVRADGTIKWSGGTADVDTRLYRSAAKTLTIDDSAGGAATLNVVGTIQNGGTAVVGARQTGWGAPTGTATRTSFATDSVTLANLARAVKALIDDLTTHGLIGA